MHHRERSLQQQNRRGAMTLGLSAVAIVAAGGASLWLRKPARDAKTACAAGQLLKSKTLILVDRTDPFTPATSALLTAKLKRIAENAETETRVQLLAFDGTAATVPEPLFDRCKPPIAGSFLTETPQRLERRHAEQFTAPLLAALGKLATPSAAKRTELVQALAILASKARLDAPAPATTLHVFSDFEENSAAFSFTRRPPQHLDVFAAHFAAAIGDRLKDITLELHVLPPAVPGARPDPRIERAWRAAATRHGITHTYGAL